MMLESGAKRPVEEVDIEELSTENNPKVSQMQETERINKIDDDI